MTSVLGLLGSDLGRFLIVRLVSRKDGGSLGCCVLVLRSWLTGIPLVGKERKGLRDHPAIGISPYLT